MVQNSPDHVEHHSDIQPWVWVHDCDDDDDDDHPLNTKGIKLPWMRMIRSDLHQIEDPWEKHIDLQFIHRVCAAGTLSKTFFLLFWFTHLFSESSCWQMNQASLWKHLTTDWHLLWNYYYIYSEILKFRPSLL